MSWEAFISADVAAAAAPASPKRSEPTEEVPAIGRSPMPWMLHVPETISELLGRMPQVVDAEAPIWDLSGSSGTLHGPPEKKKRKSAAEAIQMPDCQRKVQRRSGPCAPKSNA